MGTPRRRWPTPRAGLVRATVLNPAGQSRTFRVSRTRSAVRLLRYVAEVNRDGQITRYDARRFTVARRLLDAADSVHPGSRNRLTEREILRYARRHGRRAIGIVEHQKRRLLRIARARQRGERALRRLRSGGVLHASLRRDGRWPRGPPRGGSCPTRARPRQRPASRHRPPPPASAPAVVAAHARERPAAATRRRRARAGARARPA